MQQKLIAGSLWQAQYRHVPKGGSSPRHETDTSGVWYTWWETLCPTRRQGTCWEHLRLHQGQLQGRQTPLLPAISVTYNPSHPKEPMFQTRNTVFYFSSPCMYVNVCVCVFYWVFFQRNGARQHCPENPNSSSTFIQFIYLWALM